jgi:3-hydroxyacyl-CoA dehydrogenase|tara:strand:+ start:17649 stop:18149 length:501 start_codon:yes stop_codon:yes gene_type:complete
VATDDLGDALQDVFWLACDHLLMCHTNPWELDEGLCEWGYATGPCEVMDHLGLDIVLERRAGAGSTILRRMVAEGRMGKIGGVGHYRYPGGGGAVIDPLIEDLILEEAYFAKQIRTAMDDGALVKHLNAALAQSIEDAVSNGADRGDMIALAIERLHFPAAKVATL